MRCAFGAAHSGKPPAYRQRASKRNMRLRRRRCLYVCGIRSMPFLWLRLRRSLRWWSEKEITVGKPEAYRYVLRHRRNACSKNFHTFAAKPGEAKTNLIANNVNPV